jgi:superfamily II DNA/RNA helicase
MVGQGWYVIIHLSSCSTTHGADTAGRKSTLIFCINLDHVRNLTQLFRHTGINAQYIYAGTPPLERQALVTNFKAGKYPVLINCGTCVVAWNEITNYSGLLPLT